MQLPVEVENECITFICTGSSIICNPPVLDTDFDFVLLLTEEDYKNGAVDKFSAMGFTLPEHSDDKDKDEQYLAEMAEIQKHATAGKPLYLQFFTMRRDNVNIIVTCCHTLFKRWWNATVWATTLNLQSKKDRRDFFMLVKYGPESAKNGSVL